MAGEVWNMVGSGINIGWFMLLVGIALGMGMLYIVAYYLKGRAQSWQKLYDTFKQQADTEEGSVGFVIKDTTWRFYTGVRLKNGLENY